MSCPAGAGVPAGGLAGLRLQGLRGGLAGSGPAYEQAPPALAAALAWAGRGGAAGRAVPGRAHRVGAGGLALVDQVVALGADGGRLTAGLPEPAAGGAAAAGGAPRADPRGELRVVAASSEAARLLELFQLQSDQGPCLDCFRSGQPVAATDLTTDKRWPRFAAAAGQAGFSAVQALPMRLRDQVIGALNLFRVTPGAFDAGVVPVGQALADVATISLLHERSMRRSDTLNEQLQVALNSRVVIEQAKGKLAERLGIDVDQAFTLLRAQARNQNQRLSDLARAFVDGTRPWPAPPAIAQGTSRLAGTRRHHPGPRAAL